MIGEHPLTSADYSRRYRAKHRERYNRKNRERLRRNRARDPERHRLYNKRCTTKAILGYSPI